MKQIIFLNIFFVFYFLEYDIVLTLPPELQCVRSFELDWKLTLEINISISSTLFMKHSRDYRDCLLWIQHVVLGVDFIFLFLNHHRIQHLYRKSVVCTFHARQK